MMELLSQTMCDASNEAASLALLIWGRNIPEDLAKNADRVFYVNGGPKASPRPVAKGVSKSKKPTDSGGSQNH